MLGVTNTSSNHTIALVMLGVTNTSSNHTIALVMLSVTQVLLEIKLPQRKINITTIVIIIVKRCLKSLQAYCFNYLSLFFK